ncbi:hypothetical protein BJX96DRAFT_159527 [Aspergillus floccosus]
MRVGLELSNSLPACDGRIKSRPYSKRVMIPEGCRRSYKRVNRSRRNGWALHWPWRSQHDVQDGRDYELLTIASAVCTGIATVEWHLPGMVARIVSRSLKILCTILNTALPKATNYLISGD